MGTAAEVKLRMLAGADAGLQAILGTAPFRFFAIQEPQGYITQGVCCRYRRVSAVYLYAQEAIANAEQVRIQFEFLAYAPTDAWDAMQAFIAFMGGVNLMTDQQFQSPPVTPTQHPNYLLTTRPSIEYRPEREIYIWSCDWRIWNNTNL